MKLLILDTLLGSHDSVSVEVENPSSVSICKQEEYDDWSQTLDGFLNEKWFFWVVPKAPAKNFDRPCDQHHEVEHQERQVSVEFESQSESREQPPNLFFSATNLVFSDMLLESWFILIPVRTNKTKSATAKPMSAKKNPETTILAICLSINEKFKIGMERNVTAIDPNMTKQ
jgi:hypothetical protein